MKQMINSIKDIGTIESLESLKSNEILKEPGLLVYYLGCNKMGVFLVGTKDQFDSLFCSLICSIIENTDLIKIGDYSDFQYILDVTKYINIKNLI